MILVRCRKLRQLNWLCVIEGHAGYADPGEDIVCAAVSSVAYMTANTITEIIKADTEVAVEDGMMFVKVAAGDALRCRDLLTGLKLHLIGIEGSIGSYSSQLFGGVSNAKD